jgi:hypothetical protein
VAHLRGENARPSRSGKWEVGGGGPRGEKGDHREASDASARAGQGHVQRRSRLVADNGRDKKLRN